MKIKPIPQILYRSKSIKNYYEPAGIPIPGNKDSYYKKQAYRRPPPTRVADAP